MDLIGKFKSLVTGASVVLSGASSPPISPHPPSDLAFQTREFTELMEDPIAFAHFQHAQGSLLATEGEYGLFSLFTQHPILNEAFVHLGRARSRKMRGYSFMSKLTTVQLRDWTIQYKGDRIYQILYQTVVELAQSLGFRKAAIDNLELYVAPGDANAFTVSGSDDKIIIVVQAGMLVDLSIGQIKAVIAHELMHIRRNHIILEQMTKMMLTLMGSVLTEGLTLPSQGPTEEEINQRKTELVKAYRIHAVQRVLCPPPGCEILHPTARRLDGAAAETQAASEETNDVIGHLMNLEKTLRSDQKGLIQLLIAFARRAAKVIEEVGSSPESVAYFNRIAVRLSQDPQSVYDLDTQVKPELFNAHAKNLLGALSQSVETTADRGAASQVPNIKLAAGLARVMGLPFNLEHETKILAQIAAQGEDVLNTSSPEFLSQFLAQAGDHPFMILRINNIIRNMPAYPFSLFANRFSKLLLIYQSILEETLLLEMQLKHLPTDRAQLRPDLEERSRRVLATLDRVWEIIGRALTAPIVDRDINPRFRNLAEYILVKREILLDTETSLAQLEQSLRGKSDMDYTQALNLQKARLNLERTVLSKLIARASQLTQERSGLSAKERESRLQILTVADTVNDIDAIRNLRMGLTPSVQDTAKRRYGRMGLDAASSVHVPKIRVARGKDDAQTSRPRTEQAAKSEDTPPENHRITHFADCAGYFLTESTPR